MLATQDAGKYFSRKIFFMSFQVSMEPGRIEKSHASAAPFKEKGKAFNFTCSSFNFIWSHANTNHVELLKMSLRIFSCKTIGCWQQMYKTRFEFKVQITVYVYSQWLVFNVRSNKLLECLLSCNSHDVDASFLS